MNIQVVRTIARELGIKPGKLNKAHLIKSIQVKEGNFDCYATAEHGACDQHSCTWSKDCFSAAKKSRS